MTGAGFQNLQFHKLIHLENKLMMLKGGLGNGRERGRE